MPRPTVYFLIFTRIIFDDQHSYKAPNNVVFFTHLLIPSTLGPKIFLSSLCSLRRNVKKIIEHRYSNYWGCIECNYIRWLQEKASDWKLTLGCWILCFRYRASSIDYKWMFQQMWLILYLYFLCFLSPYMFRAFTGPSSGVSISTARPPPRTHGQSTSTARAKW
jgi:hypothetical protein